MNLQFKAKHFYFVANTLKDIVASQFFSLLNEIKQETAGKADDDLATINVSAQDVATVYAIHSMKPEGQVSSINAEMGAMLASQIQSNAGIKEWDDLAIKISEIRANNLAATGSSILLGKEFLHGTI